MGRPATSIIRQLLPRLWRSITRAPYKSAPGLSSKSVNSTIGPPCALRGGHFSFAYERSVTQNMRARINPPDQIAARNPDRIMLLYLRSLRRSDAGPILIALLILFCL